MKLLIFTFLKYKRREKEKINGYISYKFTNQAIRNFTSGNVYFHRCVKCKIGPLATSESKNLGRYEERIVYEIVISAIGN